MRAASVELASSWSASRMRAASRARVRAGFAATRATLGHSRAARRGGRPLVERPAGVVVARVRRIGGSASTRVASSVRAWWVTDSGRRSTRNGRDDATAAVPTRMRSAGVTPEPNGRGHVAHQGDVLGRGRPAGPIGQLARPQQLGHVLEGGGADQLDRVVSPVAQLAVRGSRSAWWTAPRRRCRCDGRRCGDGCAGPGPRPRRGRTGWSVRRRPSGAAAGPGSRRRRRWPA